MKRDFNKWLSTFRPTIASYDYYIDFNKVVRNVEDIKIELNILNSLIGSKNIENDFASLIKRYPECLKCIPILLAVREQEIFAQDDEGAFSYNFNELNHDIEQYKVFMRKTGLFDMLSNHIINNIIDYVTGVETGLDSNGRKNRGGHLMENLVESFIKKAGYKKEKNYFKEMRISEVSRRWNLDLSKLSNNGKTEKRFDFVIKAPNNVYLVETNFYGAGGSKLNETARSYKTLALEAKDLKGVKFLWFTDGMGWKSARHNLEETFDVLDTIYNIKDLESGIIKKLD